MALNALARDEEGQATIEYILLLATITAAFVLVSSFFTNNKLQNSLSSSLQNDFHYTYQYGKATTRGYGDQGGPVDHPRIPTGNNFRIFINPGQQ